MGNSCGNGAAGRQRVCLMERHTLSEEQLTKLEELFKKTAKGKRFVSFKEFLHLYPETGKHHQRDEADLHSVYFAFADSKTNSLKFDGFVALMLLSNRVGSVDEPERMRALFNVMDPAGCQRIPRADFRRFVRSFVADDDDKDDDAEQERDGPAAGQTDQTDAKEPNGNSKAVEAEVIEFDEFSEFCANRKGAYGAICSYVFPM